MNEDRHDRFARRARELHGTALESLSPRTRAQLHNRLRATLAATPRAARADWRWVAAPALALALVVGLPWQGAQSPEGDPVPVAAVAANALDTPAAALEQDPEFYAWLGSADALALASE